MEKIKEHNKSYEKLSWAPWELSVLRRETKVQTIKEQSQEQVRTPKCEKGRLREREREKRANGVMNISSKGTQSGVRNALKSGISAAYFTHTDIVYVFSRKYWVMK